MGVVTMSVKLERQVIEIDDMQRGLPRVVRHILEYGDLKKTPWGPASEIPEFTVLLNHPTDVLSLAIGRKFSPSSAALSSLKIIAGEVPPDLPVNPKIDLLAQKLRTKIGPIVSALKNKPQEAVGVSTGLFSIGFIIRFDKLDMHVQEPSVNVWEEFAYDTVPCTQLQCSIANALDMKIGKYFHQTWSMYLLHSDKDKVQALFSPTDSCPYLNGVGRYGDSWGVIKKRASALLTGTQLKAPITDTELWMQFAIEKLRDKEQTNAD